ncbi:MAG: MFS transporter [Betaproteobacteria bacterium]|nr:MFS transporter [Betaproteobacteria bacterium]
MARLAVPVSAHRGLVAASAASQFLLAVGWTVYVIHLPQLAAQAGIDKRWVPWILLMDQAIFAAMDWALGTAADRVAGATARLGNAIALATLVSCGAFLAMPLVAPQGSPALFLALTVVWSATSSALRAPPFVLLGRHVPGPSQPAAAAWFLFGLGVASAIGPYLTSALKGGDPRWPFALAAVSLALATMVLARAIRANPAPTVATRTPAARLAAGPVTAFLAAVLLAGLAFQVHFALNAAPAFLRFAKPADLESLMPVFWIGFNVMLAPGVFATRRVGGVAAFALGSALGGIGAVLATSAGSLPLLVTAQFVAGAGWGIAISSAAAAALAMGRTGREGFVSGAWPARTAFRASRS